MSDVPEASVHSEDSSGNGRLDSWKEIGAYLKRDVTTVRRWEKREGLPVHRHLHDRRDSVYAYRNEIDEWWQKRRNHVAEKTSNDATVSVSGNGRERIAWSVAAVLLIAALASAATLAVKSFSAAVPGAAEVRFSIQPPDGTTFGTVTLSPDGRLLAFTASTRDGPSRLYVRPLRSLTPQTLPGTEGAAFPFWAPDGQSIGFFARGSLQRISVSGGTPRILCDAPDGRGGAWNAEGIIIFSPSRESGLSKVLASGGTAAPVTTVDHPAERGHVWPHFLPDGRHFLYLADSADVEHHHLFASALGSHERKEIMPLASNATYTRDGYMLFARDRRLIAQRFDTTRLELTGDPVPIADQVRQVVGQDHMTDFAVSTNVLMYRSLRTAATELVWRDRADRRSAFVNTPAEYSEPTLSPDQTRIAIDVFDPRPSPLFGFNLARVTSDIWILDASSGRAARFTFDPGADFDPVWSPSGDRIVFSSNRRGPLDLYQKRVSGDASEELLLESALSKHAQSWSPDGRVLVYATFEPATKTDLWMLPMTGDRTPVPLLRTAFNEEQASISPDGRWFAYTADDSGRDEVYVQPFPPSGAKWQISTGGGGDARWRADGRELFYIADDRRLMAVAIKAGAAFEPGATTPVFDSGMPPHWGEARNHYDVSRDGKRFLFMTPVDDDRSAPFTVVVNWPHIMSR